MAPRKTAKTAKKTAPVPLPVPPPAAPMPVVEDSDRVTAAVLNALGLSHEENGRTARVLQLMVARRRHPAEDDEGEGEVRELGDDEPTMPELDLNLGALAEYPFSVSTAFYMQRLADRDFSAAVSQSITKSVIRRSEGLDVAFATIVCSPTGVLVGEEVEMIGGIDQKVFFCDALPHGTAFLVVRTRPDADADLAFAMNYDKMRAEAADRALARGVRELWFAELLAGDTPTGRVEQAFELRRELARARKRVAELSEQLAKRTCQRTIGSLIDDAARHWLPHLTEEIECKLNGEETI